jgi:hypothetical protein
LKKKVTWECPCGFALETARGINAAVIMVQVHIEKFHKDYLPFGITRTEAVALLKKTGKAKRKTKTAEEMVLLN